MSTFPRPFKYVLDLQFDLFLSKLIEIIPYCSETGKKWGSG